MNSNGTTYQNGRFVNVDEVHNNTKNMTLSGFNQEGGTVTGNIENLTIESKQNTSITKGSTKGGSLSVSANGLPSGSANYSKTNGERRVVDNASTFIIGDGSNLKVAKVENTASAIGTTGNGKLSIDEYVGHNLENKDKTTTKGGSVSLSQSSIPISGVGVNYANRDLESVTKNTVIGNVEIGKSSGDEINKDLDSMTEVTKDEDTKTNVFVESQTIRYAVNPDSFKEDIQKAKNEIHDIYHAVDSTVNPQGKESRNVLQQLAETRQAKTIYNVIDSRLEIAENQKDIAKAFEGVSEDLGYKVKVIYTDPSNSPQLIGVDENGNEYIKDGTAYVDKKTGIGYILVNTKSPANRTKAGVIGTLAEEQSHVIGKFEGRQKVVPDGSEKGLESLGRPTNDYFKNQYSKNDKAIGIKSDGKDYSNVDFGENVGDASNPEDLKFKKYYREEILPKDPNYKKVKFLVSTGTNMIPGVGEVKLGIEIFVGEDLLTKEKYDLIDIIQTTTMLSKNIASRGMNKLENQLSDSKNSQKFQLRKTELDTRNQQGQNGQQHQINQNNVAQNNKNSINKTQAQGNQDYSNNQQVSQVAASNNQQGAPVSKTSDITKASKNVEKTSDVLENITDKIEIPKIKPVEDIIGTKTGNKELNNAINTRGTEYYLDLRAQKATAPIDFNGHILNGEINARGLAVGGHSTLGNNVRIDAYAAKNPISPNGVRNVVISVYNPSTGKWVQKVNRFGEVQLTTLFPESWSKSRIIVEVDIAYKNGTRSLTDPRKWIGTTPSGIKVEGYIAPNTTVYPLQ